MHFWRDCCADRLVLQTCSSSFRPIKTVVLWTSDGFLRIVFDMCFAFVKPTETPFQNGVRTMEKSIPKTWRLSTLIFSGFGIVFGSSGTSKLEPSWPKIRDIICPSPFGNQLVTTGRFGKGLGMVSAGFGTGSGRFWARLAKVRGGFYKGLRKVLGKAFLFLAAGLYWARPNKITRMTWSSHRLPCSITLWCTSFFLNYRMRAVSTTKCKFTSIA